MKTIKFNGSWPEVMAQFDGSLSVIENCSKQYSNQSHFVQEVKRHAPVDAMVFSRNKICHIVGGGHNG